MKLYHYARLENLEEIKNGSWKSGGTPGIAASARLGKEGKKARKLGVGFAFFQPLPDDWFKNPEFSCPWSWLVGRALLEIEHDNENNPAYVVDRAHTLRFQVMSKNLSADEFRQRQREAENAYAESRIDAEYYLEHSDELKYVLPEVIFHDSIPLERINILEYQPMIKEYLDVAKPSPARESYLRDLQSIPELRDWYRQYKLNKDGDEATREGGLSKV